MKGKWVSVVVAITLVVLSLGCWPAQIVQAQELITSGWSYTQAFGIGTSATATLPSNWRVDKDGANVRTVGTWAAAGTATELRAGNSMSGTAGNGIYNYGAGVADTATDRAIGWISSGSGTKSGNLYLYLENDSPTNSLGKITISYDIEKYRTGSNAAGFAVQLYYSTDGSAWTSAGADFLTTFAADANNTGFASAPGVTQSVSSKVLTLPTPIAPGGSLYLAWNYSVASGTTTTNAQGLGIDNVSLGTPLQANAITLRTLTATAPLSPLAAVPAIGLALAGGLAAWRRRKA